MNDTLRIEAPEAMTDDVLARALFAAAEQLALGDPLSKALKNPLPASERNRARTDFTETQERFRAAIEPLFELAADTGKREAGQIPLAQAGLVAQWADERIKKEHAIIRKSLIPTMRQFYTSAFESGLRNGGASRGMTDNEKLIVERQRRNEYAYLDNYMRDMLRGEGAMPYKARGELYGNALAELYWLGFLYADLSADRYLHWVMHPAEHCLDCAALSGNLIALKAQGIERADAERLGVGGRWGNGVYSARELATLAIAPQSGRLTCTTKCHCSLTEVKRPAGEPKRKEAQVPFQSLEHKEFTGTEKIVEGGRTKVRVTRQHDQGQRKGYRRRALRSEHVHVPRG